MASYKWRLADFLEENDITVYELAKARGDTRMNAIYRITRRGQESKRVDLDVLASIVLALRELTQKPVELSDILMLVEEENSGL